MRQYVTQSKGEPFTIDGQEYRLADSVPALGYIELASATGIESIELFVQLCIHPDDQARFLANLRPGAEHPIDPTVLKDVIGDAVATLGGRPLEPSTDSPPTSETDGDPSTDGPPPEASTPST